MQGGASKKFRLRRHTKKDSVSSLPDELITRILGFLPTKDAASFSFTSKKMRSLFLWLPILDFDASLISHCSNQPHLTERFPAFKTFVETVLQASLSPQLHTFRLRFGGHLRRSLQGCFLRLPCKPVCFPEVNPSQLNDWMRFPLTRSGIREIDLCIHVKSSCMLPPALFTCETLEVLKIDVNLDLAQVCALPSFRLPNLKVLRLAATLIPEDELISRLLLGCPSLEDLFVYGCFKHGHSIAVSSPSLRSLTLIFFEDWVRRRKVVLIEAPNLQHLRYSDNLADCYSVTSMNTLVEAYFSVACLIDADKEASFESMLSLVKAASNVQHLALRHICVEALDLDVLNDRLPVFRNLKHLELLHSFTYTHKWHTLLLGFLNHSPSLETIDFSSGLCNDLRPNHKTDELDCQVFETTQDIPSCLHTSLKRILIDSFSGSKREIEVLGFLLRNALVLEELIISHCSAEQMLIHDLPRASTTCSVQFNSTGDSAQG